MYVFYNYWDRKRFNAPWVCPTFPKRIDKLGCAVSEATAINAILNQKGSDRLVDIAHVMYPWSCLVCCSGFSKKKKPIQNMNLPSRAFNFISGAFGNYGKDLDFPYEKLRFVKDKAPDYVYRIIEGQQLSEEDWIKIKTNRITVIYENEETQKDDNTFIFHRLS